MTRRDYTRRDYIRFDYTRRDYTRHDYTRRDALLFFSKEILTCVVFVNTVPSCKIKMFTL